MTDLAKTLGAGRLVAHFQPIVDMETRLPVGAESLARWQRPDGTVVAPNEFLPLIEDAGAMSALTAEMLCLALDGVRAWRRAGRSCFVSLNVTAEDLQRRAFFREVRSALERRGLDETALALELSERSALEDEAQVRGTLAKLRECGVRIGLDDFGTGYSSLERLADLPLTGVKIDKTFVGSMTADGPSPWVAVPRGKVATWRPPLLFGEPGCPGRGLDPVRVVTQAACFSGWS